MIQFIKETAGEIGFHRNAGRIRAAMPAGIAQSHADRQGDMQRAIFNCPCRCAAGNNRLNAARRAGIETPFRTQAGKAAVLAGNDLLHQIALRRSGPGRRTGLRRMRAVHRKTSFKWIEDSLSSYEKSNGMVLAASIRCADIIRYAKDAQKGDNRWQTAEFD